MSAGAFEISKYERDNGDIHPVQVQPETLQATVGGTANSAPAGAIDNDISAKVGKGKREIGLGTRTVSFTWNSGGAPTGYLEGGSITIPILQQSVWAGVNRGDAVSYLTGSGTVTGKTAESVR